MSYSSDLKKATLAQSFNQAGDKFRALRDARLEQSRRSEEYNFEKQDRQLKLEEARQDARLHPATVELAQKKLKLGNQRAELELKKQESALRYQEYDANQKAEHLAKQIQLVNDITARGNNPEMFGDLMIVPDLETGQVTLKSRSRMQHSQAAEDAKIAASQSTTNKNNNAIMTNNLNTARKLAYNPETGEVDDAKFKEYFDRLNSDQGSATGAQTSQGGAAGTQKTQYVVGQVINTPKGPHRVIVNPDTGEVDQNDPDLEPAA